MTYQEESKGRKGRERGGEREAVKGEYILILFAVSTVLLEQSPTIHLVRVVLFLVLQVYTL